jgi:hypothetical protein
MVMITGKRSMSLISRVAPKMTERDRDREAEDEQDTLPPAAAATGDDVVEAHHQVGDQDGLDRGEELVARLDLLVVPPPESAA